MDPSHFKVVCLRLKWILLCENVVSLPPDGVAVPPSSNDVLFRKEKKFVVGFFIYSIFRQNTVLILPTLVIRISNISRMGEGDLNIKNDKAKRTRALNKGIHASPCNLAPTSLPKLDPIEKKCQPNFA